MLRVSYEESLLLEAAVRDLEQEAKDAMIERGLRIVPVDGAAMQAWLHAVKSSYPEIRGKVIPADYFDETLRLRDEFRAQQTEK
jgi:TRAP-type C4-dicarboxylate transport system substrate-binding protein